MSESDDIQLLDYGSTHDYQGDIYRRSRYTVAFIIILTGILGSGSALMAAAFRSASVGLTPRLWIAVAVPMLGVFGLAVLLSRQIRASYKRIVIFLPLVFLFVSILSIEIWFAAEEWQFLRSAKTNGQPITHKPRWQPFETSGLVWNGTKLTAHD